MNRYSSRLVFVRMLVLLGGIAFGGMVLSVPHVTWADGTTEKTDAAASFKSTAPTATYDDSQPGADDPRVKEGFAAYKAGDFKKAYDIWLPLAEAGNAEAQFRVGRLYNLGEGTLKNIHKAIIWYENAIQKSHASAAFNLGLIYDSGEIGITAPLKAFKAYKIGAENGNAKAQHSLGISYAIGEKTSRDFVEAYKWLFIAVRNGREEAMGTISKLNRFAAPEDRHSGLEKMREWFESHPRN